MKAQRLAKFHRNRPHFKEVMVKFCQYRENGHGNQALSYLRISWVRAKVSFAILRSALLCLMGSRTPRRRNLDVKERDLEIEKGQAGLP